MATKDNIKTLQLALLNDNTTNDINPKDNRDSFDLVLDNQLGLIQDELSATPLTNTYIADNAITTSKYADSSVTEDKLATSSVSSAKIKAANVQTAAIKDLNVTLGKLSQPVQDLLTAVGGGTITNNPDDEDLESDASKLKFKDRTASGNQKGYKIIRKNFDFTNIPAGYADSIWEIRYDHDLIGASFTVPNNVILKFNGGFISNYGTITGDNTKIECGLSQLFDASGDLSGSWDLIESYPQWFGAEIGGVVDCTESIRKCLPLKRIKLKRGIYKITNQITLEDNVSIVGEEGVSFTGITTDNIPYFDLSPDLNNVELRDFDVDDPLRGDTGGFTGVINSNADNTINNLKIINIGIDIGGTLNCGINFINDVGEINDVLIRDCNIKCGGQTLYGINFRKKTNRITVAFNYLELPHVDSYNAIAIYADSNDFNIIGNTCESSGHSPIAVSNGQYGTIVGNICKNVPKVAEAGIEVEWKESHGGVDVGHDVSITGNYVSDCYYGVLIIKRDVTNTDLIKNVSVVGNVIASTTYGVYATDIEKGVVISSNSISDTATGIYTDNSSKVVINGNTIESSLSCIHGGASVESPSIVGNVGAVSLNATGIYLADAVSSFDISHNQIEFLASTSSSGIRVTACDSGIISNNTLTSPVFYGIRLEAGANNVRVDNNIIESATTNQNLGTGNKFINNEGIAQAKTTGTSSQRATFSYDGYLFFDTTLGKPIWLYSGSWRDATGTVV